MTILYESGKEKFYTVKEAADILDMSIHQIYKLVKMEKIPSQNLSDNMTRIPKDGIQKSYSIKTARKHLDMSEKTLRKLISDGKIKVNNYGERLTRITDEEINAYIKKNITPVKKERKQ